ncbi:hypothetical protein AB4Y95_00245 [Arthrobacter sp. M-10]|uniref:hypothetical protein n=1 Tax=Arthrobacter sp. M-10 TaxID=3233037 RepID=UPI003F8ECD30
MSGLNEPVNNIPQPVAVSPDLVDLAHATRPKKTIPVWVRVAVDDGSERTEPGFAQGWTREHVLVQVQWPADYYKGAREFWVEATRVRRRVIDPGRF